MQLPGLKKISFKGVIDRIDAGTDMVMVIDYKTGYSRSYSGIERDPLKNGTRLQLPVYAMAARKMFDDEREIRAAYWFISAAGTIALRK